MKLDILAFGAHADDVEIGMAGTITKYAKNGYKVGICDLTEAELSSNGTVEIRKTEAKRAAEVMGVCYRNNLGFKDRGMQLNDATLRKVVSIIRETKPSFIYSPYAIDRHPDHGKCAEIINEAVFNAGITNYKDEMNLPPHKVKDHYSYFINGFHHPDFVEDITDFIEQKKATLLTYKSQFILDDSSKVTPLTDGYIETVIARERLIGKEVGLTYAEGFKTNKPLVMTNLFGAKL
ncbi:bacillithiol biosynthesis deacetylase BshB1 [Lottiidibacillus patelloidae]|uniref:Bacillithiol biosynthesis deacetylase BshB1 n=1 Tax=Lottiidibacillus patelloidae TaxID=2670334 RepID=A0A263BU69_9BACI|nr:bacillithiol biosynthesis deacetylase BshB1 [Lottiidibacillus patelloidae]OZM57293.1 bacillithiol biosynthesis deacetylase BshB1 [Lottiidibacillus patelloidae]